MKTKAILFVAPGRVELGDIELPDPTDRQVLIEALYSCISVGTELRVLAGQQGGTEFPGIPGYSNVGRVLACGKDSSFKEGDLVFSQGTSVASVARIWGGHVAHGIQKDWDVTPIPAGLDPLVAVMAKLSAIGLHGVRCAPPLPQSRVVVVGLGPIGQFSARHYDLSGAKVLAVDLVPWRVEMIRKIGIDAFTAERGRTLSEQILQRLPGGADIVVDSTGVPAVMKDLVSAARGMEWADVELRQAVYVVQGSYIGDVTLPYWEAFYKELRLVLPRDSQPQDIRLSLERMATGKLQCRDMLSAVRKPEEAANTYAELQDRNNQLMTVAFEWKKP